MGIFSPSPMELKVSEPIHQMVARAFLSGAIKVSSNMFSNASYHFVGPHGVVYRGTKPAWLKGADRTVAEICERVQQDFNERMAAIDKARQYARDTLAVAPLFTPLNTDDE